MKDKFRKLAEEVQEKSFWLATEGNSKEAAITLIKMALKGCAKKYVSKIRILR